MFELRQAISLVFRADRHRQHGRPVEAILERTRGGAEHLVRIADRLDLSGFKHDDGGGEPHHLLDRMGDINDRDLELVANALDERHDLELARHVERRQRLIEQQQLRAGQERAADRRLAGARRPKAAPDGAPAKRRSQASR